MTRTPPLLVLAHDSEHPERSTSGRINLARALLGWADWCPADRTQALLTLDVALAARTPSQALAALADGLTSTGWCRPCAIAVHEVVMAINGSTIDRIKQTRTT